MESLNENWEASRSLMFIKAIILSQSPGISKECDICHNKVPWLLRCDECSGRWMCRKCDLAMHKELLFYDREALIDGSFRHTPPNVIMNEDGKMEQSRGYLIFSI